MLTKELIEKKYPGKKLEQIKYLDLWGNNLENIDLLSTMHSLKIINLSSNKINSLKAFTSLKNLQELYLRNNQISNLNDIKYLQNCTNLKSLWLEDNPISNNNNSEYKKVILKTLTNLEKLDDKNIPEIKKEIDDNNNNNFDENNIQITEHNEKNSLITTNDTNQLDQLLLDYGKDDSTTVNDDKINSKDNINKENQLLDSKSDIFKSNIIKNNETQNIIKKGENEEIINNTPIQNFNLETRPNDNLVKEILNNVDTSQTILRKQNLNQKEIIPKQNDNNFTNNLNDMIKNMNKINIDESDEMAKISNTGINNILKDVQTSQSIIKKDLNNQKIIKESYIVDLDKFEKPKPQNISIDDIKKMFNDDYTKNVNNLYPNKHVSNSKINDIFKNENISSDSSFFSKKKQKGPYKPILNHYNDDNTNEMFQKNEYNLNPNHMNKINALINLLNDLNKDNLILVKNQILMMVEKKK